MTKFAALLTLIAAVLVTFWLLRKEEEIEPELDETDFVGA